MISSRRQQRVLHRPARVQGVAGGLTDEDQQGQQNGQGEEAGEAQPRCVNVVLALGEQLTEGRGPSRQPEAEKIQGREGGNGAA